MDDVTIAAISFLCVLITVFATFCKKWFFEQPSVCSKTLPWCYHALGFPVVSLSMTGPKGESAFLSTFKQAFDNICLNPIHQNHSWKYVLCEHISNDYKNCWYILLCFKLKNKPSAASNQQQQHSRLCVFVGALIVHTISDRRNDHHDSEFPTATTVVCLNKAFRNLNQTLRERSFSFTI